MSKKIVLFAMVLALASVASAQMPVIEDFSGYPTMNPLIVQTSGLGYPIFRNPDNSTGPGLYLDSGGEGQYKIDAAESDFEVEYRITPHNNAGHMYVELLASVDAVPGSGLETLTSPGAIRLSLSTAMDATNDFSWSVADGTGAWGTETLYDVGYENCGHPTTETGQMIKVALAGNSMDIWQKEQQDAGWTEVVLGADVTGRAASGYVNMGFTTLYGAGGAAGSFDDLVYTPEPVTLIMLGMGGLALLRKRR